MKIARTHAVRLLDCLGVRHELREYEVDPEDLAAETVARKVGLPPEQGFKTLVAHGDKKGVCLAVVPGDCELDLKTLAKATADRKVASAEEAQEVALHCKVVAPGGVFEDLEPDARRGAEAEARLLESESNP